MEKYQFPFWNSLISHVPPVSPLAGVIIVAMVNKWMLQDAAGKVNADVFCKQLIGHPHIFLWVWAPWLIMKGN